MHIIMAVLSLALLIGAGPASAQATHTATVSVVTFGRSARRGPGRS
jgi:hypothetical protein